MHYKSCEHDSGGVGCLSREEIPVPETPTFFLRCPRHEAWWRRRSSQCFIAHSPITPKCLRFRPSKKVLTVAIQGLQTTHYPKRALISLSDANSLIETLLSIHSHFTSDVPTSLPRMQKAFAGGDPPLITSSQRNVNFVLFLQAGVGGGWRTSSAPAAEPLGADQYTAGCLSGAEAHRAQGQRQVPFVCLLEPELDTTAFFKMPIHPFEITGATSAC